MRSPSGRAGGSRGRPVSRRRALALGAVGVVGAVGGGAGVWWGARHLADRRDPEQPQPRELVGPGFSGELDSRALGRTAQWWVSLPPGSRTPGSLPPELPVCVVLHGKGGDVASMQDLGYPQARNALVARGAPPFALASISGGNGYWHRRRSGQDAGALVVQEFLPHLAGLGLRCGPDDPIALTGWSMGGFGALWLASALGLERVGAVATASAALWTSPGRTPDGAFDDAADFRRHDPLTRAGTLTGLPIRLDCGLDDPFIDANRALARRLRPAPATGFGPGGHTAPYWRSVAGRQLDFLAKAWLSAT